MKYDKVVLLLNGGSGVGKTTIAEKLCERIGYHYIRSITNRPPREQSDSDHIFEDNEGARDILLLGDIMASTVYGGYVYFTLEDQFRKGLVNVYVVDDLGVCNAINYMRKWEDTGFATVRIKSSRECDRSHRDYSFLKDDDFMLTITNDGDVEEAVEQIHEFMREHI